VRALSPRRAATPPPRSSRSHSFAPRAASQSLDDFDKNKLFAPNNDHAKGKILKKSLLKGVQFYKLSQIQLRNEHLIFSKSLRGIQKALIKYL
jgi:hypothetical protein